MVSNEKSLVDELRESREKWVVSWHFFVTDFTKKYIDSIFCFYEGEDSKYYDTRIKARTFKNIMRYPVGNKENVMRLRNKITKADLYKEGITLFFVDSDYDDDKTEDNLYVTPTYSIENFYVNNSTFSNILETEFYLNCSSDLYKIYMELFRERFEEFLNHSCDFNAAIAVNRRNKEKKSLVSVNDIKTNKLFNITIDSVSKTDKHDTVVKELLDKMKISESDIQLTLEEFKKSENKSSLFRGKNLLDFFVTVINSLIEKHNKTVRSSNELKKCTLNISNNRLSELSQYASTPNCLNVFLSKNIK